MLFKFLLDMYNFLSLKVFWLRSCFFLRLIDYILFLFIFNKNIGFFFLRICLWRFVLVINVLKFYKGEVIYFVIIFVFIEVFIIVCCLFDNGFKIYIYRKGIF